MIKDRPTAEGIEKSSIIITEVKVVYVYAKMTATNKKFLLATNIPKPGVLTENSGVSVD